MPAKIIVDLGYGDAGKGTMVDYFCATEKVDLVVRYNGGAQCGHNVVLPDGTHHTFSQFGAGTFHGVPTYLSQFVLVNPIFLYKEAYELEQLIGHNPLDNLLVHKDAIITTPFHIAANRMKEMARGKDRHGSCGLGIGETMQDHEAGIRLRVGETKSKRHLWAKLKIIQHLKRMEVVEILDKVPMGAQLLEATDTLWNKDEVDECVDFYFGLQDRVDIIANLPHAPNYNYVFEGGQGVLLDQDYGVEPYRTWSKTTSYNAELICKEFGITEIEKIGVTRAFMTRHGAGPFKTEDSGLTKSLHDTNNPTNTWQGDFRWGWLNANELADAIRWTDGVHSLAVTWMDKLRHRASWRMWTGGHYERHTPDMDVVADVLANTFAIPVKYISYAPTYKEKIVRG